MSQLRKARSGVRSILGVLLASLTVSCTSPTTSDRYGVNTEREDGSLAATSEERIEAIRERYRERFEEACEEIWSKSPDGIMYYSGEGYTVDDCTALIDETSADDALDEDEAGERGYEEGLDAAFRVSPEEKLCWGRTCWTRDNLDGYDWPSEDQPDNSNIDEQEPEEEMEDQDDFTETEEESEEENGGTGE